MSDKIWEICVCFLKKVSNKKRGCQIIFFYALIEAFVHFNAIMQFLFAFFFVGIKFWFMKHSYWLLCNQSNENQCSLFGGNFLWIVQQKQRKKCFSGTYFLIRGTKWNLLCRIFFCSFFSLKRVNRVESHVHEMCFWNLFQFWFLGRLLDSELYILWRYIAPHKFYGQFRN